jgi:hypothetical protein
MEGGMWRELAETPQMKRVAWVVGTVFAVMSAYNTISDFPSNVAKHEHTIVVVVGVILGLVLLIASYAFLYLSINAVLFILAAVAGALRRFIFKRPRGTNPAANTKWFVASQAIALALTVVIGVATHGRIFSVFTYPFEKARKDNYNKLMEQGLRECLSDPHNQSDAAKSLCYGEYRMLK